MRSDREDVTQLLLRWRNGDRSALDQLLPLVRRELDQLARRRLAREHKDHTMQPSSLIQEAFLHLLQGMISPGRIERISMQWRLR
jgi:hypothetical protein